METSKEQILLVGYGLKLLGDTRIRTGRICRTDKGYKELRKLNCDEKELYLCTMQKNTYLKMDLVQ